MVKGISRQVIVVNSQDKKLFDQAIFILHESATGSDGVTDAQLLREAGRLMESPGERMRSKWLHRGLWAFSGAAVMLLIWMLTVVV